MATTEWGGISIPQALKKEVDEFVRHSNKYQSTSEFARHAIAEKLAREKVAVLSPDSNKAEFSREEFEVEDAPDISEFVELAKSGKLAQPGEREKKTKSTKDLEKVIDAHIVCAEAEGTAKQ